MTNKQWLIKEIQNMSDEELAKFLNGSEEFCNIINPEDDCYSESDGCLNCKINWLKSEHKEIPKLSDAERVILENVDEKRKWIARSGVGSLQVFTNRPTKSNMMWMDKEGYDFLGPLNHLFQFIKWKDENPYNIEELIKGR